MVGPSIERESGLLKGTAGGMRAAGGDRRRLLLTETTIGIIVAGGVFPLLVWLAKVPSPGRLGGSDGFIADAAKATTPAVFLMALFVTLELRIRGRAGRLAEQTYRDPRWTRKR